MPQPIRAARRAGHPRPSTAAPAKTLSGALDALDNTLSEHHELLALLLRRLAEVGGPKLLYTIKDCAALLSLSRVKAYELIQLGQLQTTSIGRARRVSHRALLDYVEHLERDGGGGEYAL